MGEYSKEIFIAILALIGGLTLNWAQRRNDRRIEFKTKLKILYNLVFESIKHSETQRDGILQLIETVNNDNTAMPLLHVPAYPALNHLSDKVISDEYFTSFDVILKDCIDNEKQFFNLKYNSIYLKETLLQTIAMSTVALEEHRKRIKQFIELYRGFKILITEISFAENATPFDNQIHIQLLAAYQNFIDNREENDGNGNITELTNNFVTPLQQIVVQTHTKMFFPLVVHLGNMAEISKEISFQNATIAADLNDMIDDINHAIANFKISYNYLSNSQINSKFH